MDKIKDKTITIYDITGIMFDHHLSAEQAVYLTCLLEGIEYNASATDINSLYNKGLLIKGKVNSVLLFHLKDSEQLTLSLNPSSKPNSTEVSLKIAHSIEKEFVIDKFAEFTERKRIADRYFKGDVSVARYFIIFKALFPVKSKTRNAKWNKKFGFIYEGIGLWDDGVTIAKKFHKIYQRLDIGIFLEATYRRVKDSIDFDQELCFMTKPNKFLIAFDSYYQDTAEIVEKRISKKHKDASINIDKLKL